jgi:hypothetical protein
VIFSSFNAILLAAIMGSNVAWGEAGGYEWFRLVGRNNE